MVAVKFIYILLYIYIMSQTLFTFQQNFNTEIVGNTLYIKGKTIIDGNNYEGGNWVPLVIVPGDNINTIEGVDNCIIEFTSNTNTISSIFNHTTGNDFTIKNITITGSNNTLLKDGMVNKCVKTTIINCGVENLIIENGGIISEFDNIDDNYAKIISCWTTGQIGIDENSKKVGGIFIQEAYDYPVDIINCYTTGDIMGNNEYPDVANNNGGICGILISNTNIIGCYSTGKINGIGSGGIVGLVNSNKNNVNIISCYSTGDIIGVKSGGICGQMYNGNVVACYSTGNIIGGGAGGICGGNTGIIRRYDNEIKSLEDIEEVANIICCFSVGDICGEHSGGICGIGTSSIDFDIVQFAGIKTNIIGCYSCGKIKGEYAGGICGSNFCSIFSTFNYICTSGNCSLSNSFWDGSVRENCNRWNGLDLYKKSGLLNIIGCYTTGQLCNDTAGGICGGFGGSRINNTDDFLAPNHPPPPSELPQELQDKLDDNYIGEEFILNANIFYCYTLSNNPDHNENKIVGVNCTSIVCFMTLIECFTRNGLTWNKVLDKDNSLSSVVPQTNKLYYYTSFKEPDAQLELRFFRSLAWDPRHCIDQKPFLLDWSDCNFIKSFYDCWFNVCKNSWYISNPVDFPIYPTDYVDKPASPSQDEDYINDVTDNIVKLFENIKCMEELGNYNPNEFADKIKIKKLTICELNLYDMVYVIEDGKIIRITKLSNHKVNDTYTCKNRFIRVNTEYPVNSEFINNSNTTNPFLTNFSCSPEYPISYSNWLEINDCKNIVKLTPNFNCHSLKITPFKQLLYKYTIRDYDKNNIIKCESSDKKCIIIKELDLCKKYKINIYNNTENINIDIIYNPKKYMFNQCRKKYVFCK